MQLTTNTRKHLRGFTLVELAIVITIVALLAVGILSAQSLLRNSRSQAVIKEVGNLIEMVRIFQTTYNSLPGDMPTPGTLLPTGTGTLVGGNNDGVITWAHGAAAGASHEGAQAFLHMMRAGMLDGNYSGTGGVPILVTATGGNIPISKISGAGYVIGSDGALGNLFRLGEPNPSGNTWANIQNPVVTPDNALTIDQKMDDGVPGTGRVQSTGCSNGSGNYDLEVEDPACLMIFRFDPNAKG